jgi:hypothetical protein
MAVSEQRKNVCGITHPHPVPNKPNAEADIPRVEQHVLQEPSANVGAMHVVVHNPTGQQYRGITVQETGRVRQKLHPIQGMAIHESEKKEQTVRKVAGIIVTTPQQVEENKQQNDGTMIAKKQCPRKLNSVTNPTAQDSINTIGTIQKVETTTVGNCTQNLNGSSGQRAQGNQPHKPSIKAVHSPGTQSKKTIGSVQQRLVMQPTTEKRGVHGGNTGHK